MGQDPETLDPARIWDIYSRSVAQQVFDGLVQFDQTLNITPALAQFWVASRDWLTWTFTLRKGVKFHHGREVTADQAPQLVGLTERSRERIELLAHRRENVLLLGRLEECLGVDAVSDSHLEAAPFLTDQSPRLPAPLLVASSSVAPVASGYERFPRPCDARGSGPASVACSKRDGH